MNLGSYVSRSARYWPDAFAVTYKEKRYTYKDFDNRTNRFAQGLISLGLKKGDKLAIQSWNRNEIIEAEIACYKAGLTKVPANARLSTEETLHLINDSEADAIITDSHHLDSILSIKSAAPSLKNIISMGTVSSEVIDYETLLAKSSDLSPDVDVAEDEIAVLHYTSGTSGKLKAAIQTFGNRLAFIRKALMAPDARCIPGDVFALVGPVTHATGMNIMPVLFSGACNLIMNRFDVEELLQTIQKDKVTHLFLVPTMINMILNHPALGDYDTSSLKKIIYGTSPMSAARVKQAMDVFGPILVQGYGAGETTSMVTILTAEDHQNALVENEERLSSCGRAVFDTDVRVVNEKGKEVKVGEVGEIIVNGPDIMKGYWKAKELTDDVLKDGWYHTGDLAKMDDQGYVYIVDRKKEMIISGGFNVFPSEVESALFSHSAVYEACVIGVPDDTWGEAIKGVVVLKQGQTVSENDLIEYCTQSLASFKKPQSIEFVKELPKNPNGKIVRRVIRDLYWEGKNRQV